MHARKPGSTPQQPPPDLRLQVVDRNFTFRECNYSLYPSWLGYPWANAHLVIRGTRPFTLDRRDRGALRSEAAALSVLQENVTQYREGLDAAAIAEALRGFAQTAPRPALMRLNLNTGNMVRKVTGHLNVLGCRLASTNRGGELSTLGGVRFEPPLGSEPGGPARTDGLRVRHRIRIEPGTTVRFVLPLSLAEAVQRRPRPEHRVDELEPLPSVFTDSATFRALWPEGPSPVLGRRYAIRLDRSGAAITAVSAPHEAEQIPASEAAPVA